MNHPYAALPSLGRRRFLARLGALICALFVTGRDVRLARREASFYRKTGD